MPTCRVCSGTHAHLYRNGERWVHAECLAPKPHWDNPYDGAVPVPIEALAECDAGLGKMCGQTNGPSFLLTKEKILEHWRSCGDKLDAYILPQRDGWHCIGIRYGAEGSEYLSPLGDRDKVAALLKRYT